jgi:hypothetical protein
MKEEIGKFKNYLEDLKISKPEMDICMISTMLVAVAIAEATINCNCKIRDEEKWYFDRQAAVGRFFSDWGEDYISLTYLKMSEYLKVNHW